MVEDSPKVLEDIVSTSSSTPSLEREILVDSSPAPVPPPSQTIGLQIPYGPQSVAVANSFYAQPQNIDRMNAAATPIATAQTVAPPVVAMAETDQHEISRTFHRSNRTPGATGHPSQVTDGIRLYASAAQFRNQRDEIQEENAKLKAKLEQTEMRLHEVTRADLESFEATSTTDFCRTTAANSTRRR